MIGYQALSRAILHEKQSFLCVGLDSDLRLLPRTFKGEKNPLLAFNKAVIEATHEYAVAYKLNLAFYEYEGERGWEALRETLRYIPSGILTIADAKRGDVGNTASKYAATYLEVYDFDGITVSPYLGKDALVPFLAYKDKWTLILGLTSNPGAQDFQMLTTQTGLPLYEKVVSDCAQWGTAENIMFVVGATRPIALRRLRQILPVHFFLVPGVGAQGGDLQQLAQHGMNASCGLLVNISRAILYPEGKSIRKSAADFTTRMRRYLHDYLPTG